MSLRFFDLLNSMIYDLKRSVDLRRLFDPVLHSSLDDLVLKQMAKYDVLQFYKLFRALWRFDLLHFSLYRKVCVVWCVMVLEFKLLTFIKVSDRRTLHDHSTISKFVSLTLIVIIFCSSSYIIIS